MEKFNPTYNLEEFKNSDFIVTKTALATALTSYSNHKIWQDVYHVPYGDLVIYIKNTQNTISEFTLLSFKEK